MNQSEKSIISNALAIIEKHMVKHGVSLDNPTVVQDYLKISIGLSEIEICVGLFLDVKYRLIESVELSRGTVSEASLYPREIAKKALLLNAKAVIIAHNHPSGDVTPSNADLNVTKVIKSGLGFLDISLLDHVIVSGNNSLSMAERGII